MKRVKYVKYDFKHRRMGRINGYHAISPLMCISYPFSRRMMEVKILEHDLVLVVPANLPTLGPWLALGEGDVAMS